ncbi:MAG: glutamine amidotransferase family protein [Clostridia bacterium]|nr:glutamine amidotransferase family protein [Clostridia bacterium]
MKKEGEIRIPSGCAISGILNKNGERINGEDIITSIELMRDRSNGLGGGFAAYGIYPQYEDLYALHIFYDDLVSKASTEDFLNRHFEIETAGKIPTRKKKGIDGEPLIWRYFVLPRRFKLHESELKESEYVARCVFRINGHYEGAYVFSSGKNMGAFKGVGYPEDIGRFFMLETYEAYLWTSHGRFPTNTPGWWGGAHPFTLLNWSVVHNGEISSYDANRRFVEMYGYDCTLQTDTEVITYIFDLLLRKHKLGLKQAVEIMATPFWREIALMSEEDQKKFEAIRAVYSSALINGPFSIILGFEGGMLALNDRIKLRPLVAAEKGDTLYVASEEAAIRVICSEPERVWSPRGGEPIIGLVEGRR